MKKSFIFLPFLAVSLLTACSSDDPIADEQQTPDTPAEQPAANPDDSGSSWELSSSIELDLQEYEALNDVNIFSHNMMKEAANLSDDGEFCCSPVSASIFLSMIANASTGESHKQILSALHTADLSTLNTLNAKLLHYLPCEKYGSSLKINNRFWIANRFNVPSDFVSTMQNVYNGGVEYVDFSNEATVPAINQWVYDNTNGLIRSILSGEWEKYINTPMVCANTVYFIGVWRREFKKEDTKDDIFYGSKGNCPIKMMHQEKETDYAANEKFQLLSKDFKMAYNVAEFYLPAEGMDIREAVRLLTPEMQQSLRGSLENCMVNLSLPSFKTEKNTDFATIMNKMGVDMSNVDLSAINMGNGPVFTNQQTSLKVDEKGAEFSASTYRITTSTGEDPEYKLITISFNRPFIYIIRNRVTNTILLAGVVANPK